jgi:hypothetical protein
MTADLSPIGCTGVLVVGTRGADGPGEVVVKIRGGSEAFLAFSDEPLSKGTTVLVVETRGARSVVVTPWTDPWGDL